MTTGRINQIVDINLRNHIIIELFYEQSEHNLSPNALYLTADAQNNHMPEPHVIRVHNHKWITALTTNTPTRGRFLISWKSLKRAKIPRSL